ncbi:PREDICTED: uncharacterized protein LOC109218572 [Nicotiana attenuata]|uniref:Uncharacterized protein n=1 Tax=Nicotiana attenuata TaxID=49451 RepID=A0A1J6KIL0_NICAT|nr:PREDICTED: uncharacterized protein LOC109218572 [Nicotiana attenuata]OIT21695.1 hypothetical protein A4A49_37072 [Nicotiana attenuata]
MTFYLDEEEVWRCPKHPSKRRRNGVCPVCLKDRLVILCPDCANVRPCACYASASSSSSSASSSFSLFSSSSGRSGGGGGGGGGGCEGICSVARVSKLIESEPAFQRSKSVGIPFLRSRDKISAARRNQPPICNDKINKTPSFWSVFKLSKSKRSGESEKEGLKGKANIHHVNVINELSDSRIDDFARMMNRSRSMSVAITSVSGAGESPSKSKGWHFPSPMKVFRQSKASKLVNERSPMYRG